MMIIFISELYEICHSRAIDRIKLTQSEDSSSQSEGNHHKLTVKCILSQYFLFQPVVHNWFIKGRGMYCSVYGKVHIKDPLLLIEKSSLCGGSGFPSKKCVNVTI